MDRKSEKRSSNIQKGQSSKKSNIQKEKQSEKRNGKSEKEQVLSVELDKELKQSMYSF